MAQACSIPVMHAQDPRPKAAPPASPWVAGFALDVRSLALLRVLLAVLTLFEVGRAVTTWLPAGLLTDAGAFTREAWREATEAYPFWTPYLINGEAWFAGLLLALTAAAAFVMLLGWHTRVATALVWVLIASLHTRLDPTLLGDGEALLRVLLFWGMFLPLGARGSLDAALDIAPQRPADAYFSVASVALLVQVLLAQWLILAALVSTADSLPGWQWAGIALVLLAPALSLMPRSCARWVFVGLVAAGFVAWLLLLGAPPALYATLLLLVGLSLASRLDGELLRLVSVPLMLLLLGTLAVLEPAQAVVAVLLMVAWLSLVPAALWRRLARCFATPEWRGLVVYYDGDCGFCQLTARILRIFLALPDGCLRTAQSDTEVDEIMRRENSWVLRTAHGRTFTHYDAFVELLRRSPSGFLFAPLAGLRPVRWLGERIYRLISENRDAASRAVGWLHYRERRAVPGRLGRVVALVALIYVVGLALLGAAAPEFAWAASLEQAVRIPGEWLRLDQPRPAAG